MRKLLRFFGLTLCAGLVTFLQAYSQCATMNAPVSQMVCNGSSSTPVNFSSPISGVVYSWTNDKPGIGLPASGTGNIPAFTAVNHTNAPLTATVTVTPFKGSATYAYVPNSTSHSVSVIDVNTNVVVKTIPSIEAPRHVTSSPDGRMVYVTAGSRDEVYMINTATNTLVGSFYAYAGDGIVITPDGKKGYVALSGIASIKVFNPATGDEIGYIQLSGSPNELAITPDGSKMYVTQTGAGTISVINTATDEVISTINIGTGLWPRGIIVTPDGSKVYVTNNSSNSVYVISTATNTVSSQIPVGKNPHGIAITPDGSKVYVANSGTNDVTVINTATNTTEPATISVGVSPTGIAVSPDGSKVYVSNFNSHNISVINTATNTTESTTIAVGGRPTALGNMMVQVPCPGPSQQFTITVNPTPNVTAPTQQTLCHGTTTQAVNFMGTLPGTIHRWINNNPAIGLPASGTGNIPAFTTINTTSGYVTARVEVTPYYGSKTYAYIANTGSNNVSVVDISTGNVIKTITVGIQPYGVAVSPDGSKVYVGNRGAGSVSVINTTDNTVSATIDVNTGQVNGIAVTPDGSRVYVSGSTRTSVINTATNEVIATLGVGTSGVVVSPNGQKVYVGSESQVYVINTTDNTIETSFSVSPQGMAISPDGKKLYIADGYGLYEFNTVTNSGQKTLFFASKAVGVAISPDGNTLFVTADNSTDNVYIISTVDNTIKATLTAGSKPVGVSVSLDGSKAYIVNSSSNNVSVINTSSNTVESTIEVGNRPSAFGHFLITVGGCAGPSQSFTITVEPAPAAPTVTVSGATTFCEGGSVVLNSSDASSYWYKDGVEIPNSFGQTYNVTESGTYTAAAPRFGCMSAQSAGITVAVKPSTVITINTQPVAQVVCEGAAATFSVAATASGSSGLSYQWRKDGVAIANATAATYTINTTTAGDAGNYDVVLTGDCGTLTAAAAILTVNPSPAVPTITATGNVLSSSATVGNQWYLNGAAIAGATGQTHRVQAAGAYTVQVSQGGCTSTSAVHNFVSTRVDAPQSWGGEVSLYPNPVVKTLVVKNSAGRKLLVQVFDGLGRKVLQRQLSAVQGSLDLQGLNAGLYQVVITDQANNKTIAQSILKL